jgi:hypothetical protein
MHRTWRLAPILALPALAAAALLGPGASAQAPGARTLSLKELEKGSTFTHVRNTKTRFARANSRGDLIVFTNPLADASGQIVGKLHVNCATTVGARNFLKSVMTCSGVVVLRDGTLTLQGAVKPNAATTTVAITGGTGAYANARGVFVSAQARGGSQDTITLAG